ncbi:MAG TPA: IPT/TIG domain-containing protein [Blastocatellia bacterium]|nr:IPT/TIG domain-containing protein [Blastocatellia bacterium]HNG28176.1 IPT/TIG domain-containing protein [Blastocatellia bacterium]
MTVSTVSAASFIGGATTLAPNSIVAAFGTQLANGTQVATTQPLPTNLLNTTVTVGGVAAPLFFVSPGQVNYLIPQNVPAGDAQVVINSTAANGDQIISRGQVRIAPTAPALFTANATGTGVPAAVTGRVSAAGQFVFDPNPPFEPDPVAPGRVIPAPIDVGTDARPAFLILFGTGLRNAATGSTRAIIGGVEVPVTATAAPGFVGLDQINLQIPVALKGRGLVDVTLVSGGVSSNAVTVNLAGTPNAILSITGFSISNGAVAGQTLTISGSGFSTNANDNIVRFGSAQARVIAATANQLTVLVPFGAESGRVEIQTPQGETRSAATCRIKTSISGLVQSTGSANANPAPLEGVAVRVIGTNVSVRTNQQGAFVIPDLPTGFNSVEVDGGSAMQTPPYPRVTLKLLVQADRDNQFAQPISLQQANGGSAIVGFAGNPSSAIGNQLKQALSGRQAIGQTIPADGQQTQTPGKSVFITNRGVTLEVPIGTTVKFPDGKTNGAVQLTVVERSRLPGIALPAGVYASTIAQITPLGTTFTPGASLSFPNPDQANLPPGAKVDLYRFDFQRGAFIKRGTATVSANRATVVSDARLVDLASFWFVAAASGVTTVTGRVIDAFSSPVSRAQVTVNGRAGMTDANGGFSLSDVAAAGSQIQADVLLPQQWGTSPRGTSAATTAVVGGVTNVGTIALSNTRQTGLVLSPFVIDFDSNSPPARIDVTLTQPAPTGGLAVTLASDTPTVVTVPASVTIAAGQTTAFFNATRIGSGFALISARATLAGNTLETKAVAAVAAIAPTLSSVAPTSAAAGSAVDITGINLSSKPDDNFIFYVRNGQVVGLSDPTTNRVISSANNRTVLRVIVPRIPGGAVSLVAVVVNSTSGVFSDASAPLAFNIIRNQINAPQLASVTPAQGKPRDQVAITGGGFSVKPEENRVTFRQELNTAEARVLQAGETRLVVEVPSAGMTIGLADITVERIGVTGTFSDLSNALDFRYTAEAGPPAKPTLTSVLNAATGGNSGRDTDRIVARGTNFGLNFYDPAKDDVANTEPLITLLLFYQNNQLVNFALPVGVQNNTQITSIVPTGLNAGPVQITTVTFDLENGLLSDESNAVNFTVTAGSLRRIDEDEPNDSPELATEVSIPVIVDGKTAKGDAGEVTIRFDNGSTEVLTDLFYLSLDKTTAMTIALEFTQTADLDLFVLAENSLGMFEVLASSTKTQGTSEKLTGSLSAGNYLIAIGVFSGSSAYSLTLQAGTPTAFSPFNSLAPTANNNVRFPVLVERKKLW